MRRSFLKHLLRGELQATAHTSWWYHASGANKLAARTLASRKRYQVRVKDLSELVKKRLNLKSGKVNFHRIVLSSALEMSNVSFPGFSRRLSHTQVIVMIMKQSHDKS